MIIKGHFITLEWNEKGCYFISYLYKIAVDYKKFKIQIREKMFKIS